MTLRLDGLVVRGEIDNTHPYSVSGWLKLRGQRAPLTLNLTGDCGPTLRGLRVRFEDAIPLDDRDDFEVPDLSRLAWQQIGPTGRMQLERGHGSAGRLCLEWYSQNGRVLLELPNPVVESVDPDLEEPGEEIDEEAFLEGFEDDEEGVISFRSDDESDEDPYGLFPADFLDQLDADSEQLDVELFGNSGHDGPSMAPPDMDLIEGLMEGNGVRIHEVFDPPVRLPHAENLNNREVEIALKTLLARLAELGISLDVCRHYGPRDAYQLLLEEICPFQMTHPDLNTNLWVQHFSTSDYCEACDAEFEREVEEFERNRPNDEDDDD